MQTPTHTLTLTSTILRCDEKITKGALKIGVVTDGSWGPSTQWHHLQCTIFRIQRVEDVDGYDDLDDAYQVARVILPF